MRKCRYCKHEFLNTDPKQIYCSSECSYRYWRDKKNASYVGLDYPKVDDLEGEIWKDIEGAEGLYKISNYGRVKTNKKRIGENSEIEFVDKILKGALTKLGYNRTKVCYRNGKFKMFSTHRLVAKHFIPNPDNKPEINHIDGIKTNNHVSNLEWCTRSENMKHAVQLGLRSITEYQRKRISETHNGELSTFAKLKECDILNIRNLFVEGMSYAKISKLYPVNAGAIRCIVLGQTWKHVK